MPKLGISFQIWFFPQFWGEKWRCSEHAPASNTGLSLFPPGLRPIFRAVQEGVPEQDYSRTLIGSLILGYQVIYLSLTLYGK